MKSIINTGRVLLFLILFSACTGQQENTIIPVEHIPRLLITTDIGGDPDDTQSLIRLLLMSSEFELEGIVASASGTPNELDTAIVRPDLIRQVLDDYSKVYPTLIKHDSAYPEPQKLVSIVKSGNPMRGLDYIGEGMDTEGSRWIEKKIIETGNRPLNISIWGGQTDVAQALFSLKRKYSSEEYDRLAGLIRIYNIDDQDHIHPWFRSQFPGLFHILAKAPMGVDKREGAYRGMYLGGDESLTSREWIYANVKSNHGPLGEKYPDRTWTAPNPHGCMKEGDSPSWFYFLNNGLQDSEYPSFGGWGGRFRAEKDRYFVDASDIVDTVPLARATVYRWRPVFQSDFAARMDWCVRPFEEANHHPLAVVNGDPTKEILKIRAGRKDRIDLDAGDSSDPDGDSLDFHWWIYAEPSGLGQDMDNLADKRDRIKFTPSAFPPADEYHIILEVKDHGVPALTSYRRIIVYTRD